MDFATHYTEGQETFRKEVVAWIDSNIPAKMREPIDGDDRTPEWYRFWQEKTRELGAKGWLYPTYPKQYGGGGLTGEHETIIEEEFTKRHIHYRFGNPLFLPCLLVWGTEEQKQKFITPVMKGEKICWQKFTEPQAGTDLANYQSTAVKDGDEWVLNGSNQFVSDRGLKGQPDLLFGPMKTDPDAPRHRNLGFFMIPYPSPGLTIKKQPMVNNGIQHFIYLKDVRVPADHLIGGETQGWQVTNTALEWEHGGRGQAFPRDDEVDGLVLFMQEHKKAGHALGDDPIIQDRTVEAYSDSHILELMQKRVYAKHMAGEEMSWEGSNTGLAGRDVTLRNVGRARDIMGMYALVGSRDPRAIHGAIQEVNQRISFIRMHGGGSRNINKVIVARRMGISRTKERAAVTARV